jgi:hypothetical protein
MDNNKVLTYFKTYYPSQSTNLSGYINILTNLSFTELSNVSIHALERS